jgi:hypothetical protein
LNTTIAVAGNGRALRRTVIECLEKAIVEVPDDLRVLVEVTAGLDQETMSASRHVLDWVRKNGLPYSIAMDPSVYDMVATEYAEGVISGAVENIRTLNLVRQLEAGDVLILGWDDEDDACMRYLKSAKKSNVRVYDQTGMELVLGDPEEEDEDDYSGDWPTVYVSDIEKDVNEITKLITGLVERHVRAALESKTQIRTHK